MPSIHEIKEWLKSGVGSDELTLIEDAEIGEGE